MKTYRAKTLIAGHKVGKEFVGQTLVAVPKHRLTDGLVVQHGDGFMDVSQDGVLTEKSFEDLYGRGTYSLCYFRWRPQGQAKLFDENTP